MKPQDVLVAVRLASRPEDSTYPALAQAVGISASEAHAAVARLTEAGLVDRTTRGVRRSSLLEFLVHGLRYVFPAKWEGVTRGVPTSYAAPPLAKHFGAIDLPPVWPSAEGSARGEGLRPLYKTVPAAALRDSAYYEWLALVDAIRGGRARERKMAIDELTRRLS